MMYALVILGTLAVLIGLGAIVRFRQKGARPVQFLDFKEYVRDPSSYRREAQRLAERAESVTELATRPPEDLVRMLLDDALYRDAASALREAGPAVVPHLVQALSNPAFRAGEGEEPSDPSELLFGRSMPLVTVLRCLEHYAPESAVNSIAPLVHDPDTEVRKRAALLLGMIASDDAAAPLRHALADEDDSVPSYALMGLMRAIQAAKHMSAAFRREVFEAVLPLVSRPDRSVSGDAPRCLLHLDRERAVSAFTAPDALSPGREGLHYVLQALREAHIGVSAEVLIDLIQKLESKCTEYPNDRVIDQALQLLAISDANADRAQAIIRRALTSQSRHVREGAASALAAAKGAVLPFGVAFDRLEQAGWDGLAAPERHVLAVRMLIDEVNNGGIEQYFVNSSGDHWPDAMAGLEAIGARRNHRLMQQVIGRFGPAGPSRDRDRRHHQLAKVVKQDTEFFSPVETEFYEDEEDREVLLMLYVAAHSECFR